MEDWLLCWPEMRLTEVAFSSNCACKKRPVQWIEMFFHGKGGVPMRADKEQGTALAMPVMAPLGDFAGIDRSLVITTWAAAGGWLRLILPINAILIAGLALAKVGFDQYVRFILPLMGILLVIILAVLLLGVAL